MKKFSIIILIFFIYGCGYTSIYKYQNQDLLINIKNTKGDIEMNNFIKNEIKISSNNNSQNIFNVDFETEYKKITLVKDSTGKATDYKLNLKVIFTILSEGNQRLTFTENFKIKDNTQNFEQNNYEKEIKRNFSKNIKDKLISSLLKINDN